MQTLEQQITQQTRELPENAQREVLHYIEFIRSRYPATKPLVNAKSVGATHHSTAYGKIVQKWQTPPPMSVTYGGHAFNYG